MDQYNGIAQSIKSPTTVTNSIRDPPKSPRHPRAIPDPRGRLNQGTSQGVASQSAAANRRRPLGEMGKFAGSCTGAEVDERPEGETPPKMNKRIVGDLLSLTCQNPIRDDLSTQNVKMYTPVAKKKIGVWLDNTAAAANNFAATAAEMYQLECKSENRGRDANISGDAHEARNKCRNRGRSRMQNKERHYSMPDESSLTEAGSLSNEEPMEYTDENIRTNTPSYLSRKNEQSGSTHGKSLHDIRNSTKMQFVDDRTIDISPPRVDRTTDVNDFDPRVDNGDVMEARMELLGFGRDAIPQNEVRLARALKDLQRQDSVIDGWKRQLEMAQQHLDETFAELAKTKKESQEKQYKATEIRARAVQGQKKLQDMHEREVEHRKQLEQNVAKLQQEISTLKVSLRNSRNSLSPKGSLETANSSQIISLKAEIVDLRSRLAEAHAANIDDHSALNSVGEMDELRNKLHVAEEKLAEVHGKQIDFERIQKEYGNVIRSLNKKIERTESEAQKTQKTLEASLKAAIEEENQVRSELAKCKSNVHRLERERSRSRLQGAADVDRLTKQLAAAKDEINKLHEEVKEEKRMAKEESDKLKYELSDLRQKYADASKGLARKSDTCFHEKTKMESELGVLRMEVKQLKAVLESKEKENVSQAKRISELEMSCKDGDLVLVDPSIASGEMTKLNNDTTASAEEDVDLHAEISTPETTLPQQASSAENVDSLPNEKEGELEQLRAQLEEYQLAKQRSTEEKTFIVKLQKEIVILEKKVEFLQRKTKAQEDGEAEAKTIAESFKKEIATLKSKLSASESKCIEERLRAEEERRISKESNARYTHELDELKLESEKSGEDRLKLREELEELRKHLANAGKSLCSNAGKEGAEVPSKVNRLRHELALARARLTAAREHNGAFAISHSSISSRSSEKAEESLSVGTPEYTVQSSSNSITSTWAPPLGNSEDAGVAYPSDLGSCCDRSKEAGVAHPSDLGSCCDQSKDAGDAHPSDLESCCDQSKGAGAAHPSDLGSCCDESTNALELSDNAIGAMSPRSAFSLGQKSLIDEEEGGIFPESSIPTEMHETRLGTVRLERTCYDTSVDELRRRREESSKRLEKANTRLNGLADLPAFKKSNISFSPYRGINRDTFSTLVEEENACGVMEEVVTSEEDGIEVQRVLYADI